MSGKDKNKDKTLFAAHALDNFADIAPLKSLNITPWWHVSSNNRRYSIEAYDLGTFAHICTITMKSFLSFHRAESVTCVPYAKDFPILYIEYERHFNEETLNVDFFDTLLEPIDLYPLTDIKRSAARLPEYVMQSHWFDSLRLEPSDAKKGKHITNQLVDYVQRVIRTYSAMFPLRTICDEKAKQARNEDLVNGLVVKGSPTVNFFKQSLGNKDVEKFLRSAVFGLK